MSDGRSARPPRLFEAALVGFSLPFAATFVFLFLFHLPSGGAVGLGRWGPTFWPTIAAYTFAYGGLAGLVGAVARVVVALMRR
jgi:hypothetical protein